MTSSNGNIFRVTGHLCGEFTRQRPVTRRFNASFDLSLNKQLSKQWWDCWFETPSHPLWRHSNDRWMIVFTNAGEVTWDAMTRKGFPHYWSLWRKSTGDAWIPLTKGQGCGPLLRLLWWRCWTNSRDDHVTLLLVMKRNIGGGGGGGGALLDWGGDFIDIFQNTIIMIYFRYDIFQIRFFLFIIVSSPL